MYKQTEHLARCICTCVGYTGFGGARSAQVEAQQQAAAKLYND